MTLEERARIVYEEILLTKHKYNTTNIEDTYNQ